MLDPRIKNRFATKKRIIMRPIHLRLSEEVIGHLETTAKEHGFKNIQSLIRLYIRQGLDKDNATYRLSQDTAFIEKLIRKGISQKIIDDALSDGDTPPTDTPSNNTPMP